MTLVLTESWPSLAALSAGVGSVAALVTVAVSVALLFAAFPSTDELAVAGFASAVAPVAWFGATARTRWYVRDAPLARAGSVHDSVVVGAVQSVSFPPEPRLGVVPAGIVSVKLAPAGVPPAPTLVTTIV